MMKNIVAIVLIGAASIACSQVENVASWRFIQSVGGMAIGTPIKTKGVWILPIFVDVSGLKKFTSNPTNLNSGIVCRRITSQIEGKTIYLTVHTGIPAKTGSAKCASIEMKSMIKGKHDVFYKEQNGNRQFIAEVEFVDK